LDLARTAMSWKESKGYLRRAEALLLREGGLVPLFHEATPILISPSVKGFTPNLWGYYPFSDLSK
jgi:ABC-type oligopeptide transport system substrate-binding subunit